MLGGSGESFESASPLVPVLIQHGLPYAYELNSRHGSPIVHLPTGPRNSMLCNQAYTTDMIHKELTFGGFLPPGGLWEGKVVKMATGLLQLGSLGPSDINAGWIQTNFSTSRMELSCLALPLQPTGLHTVFFLGNREC